LQLNIKIIKFHQISNLVQRYHRRLIGNDTSVVVLVILAETIWMLFWMKGNDINFVVIIWNVTILSSLNFNRCNFCIETTSISFCNTGTISMSLWKSVKQCVFNAETISKSFCVSGTISISFCDANYESPSLNQQEQEQWHFQHTVTSMGTHKQERNIKNTSIICIYPPFPRTQWYKQLILQDKVAKKPRIWIQII
jgi:hypothetical protein